MTLAPLPTADLPSRELPLATLEPGTVLVRVHWPDRALFFGPRTGDRPRHRFDDPDGQFGVCYLAASIAGAFVETFLREGREPLIAERELRMRQLSRIRVTAALRVVECHGRGLSRLGTTSAVASGAYSRSRAWSGALHRHPSAPDGIRYRSRHDDSEFCLALFDRAASRLQVDDTIALLDPDRGVWPAMATYRVGVI